MKIVLNGDILFSLSIILRIGSLMKIGVGPTGVDIIFERGQSKGTLIFELVGCHRLVLFLAL